MLNYIKKSITNNDLDQSECSWSGERSFPWLLALLELLVVCPASRSRLLGDVDLLLIFGRNSVMTTVTLFTVTSLCIGVLLSTFFNLCCTQLELQLILLSIMYKKLNGNTPWSGFTVPSRVSIWFPLRFISLFRFLFFFIFVS